MESRVFQASFSQSQVLELCKDTSALKGAFEAGDLPAVAPKLQATLHSLENARLDIGITGGTGSGKSTFVNAIRGLGDEDPKSAYTGVVEMTADQYLQRVLPARYDFFIIITSESFTAHHAQLAREILQQGKRFYLIRSKVDVDIAASRSRRPSTFSEERVLGQIRDDSGSLKDPKVFLLSMFELGKYDFHLLEESMDVACDLYVLIKSLEGYRRSFGLDQDSLVMLAGQTGQPLHKILEVVWGPKTKVTEALVVELLDQASRDASAFTQELLNVPILGPLATCGISFATSYQMLRTSLNEAVNDAQRVLLQAFLDSSDHKLPEKPNQGSQP
ncbi:interferon-inducible GTPase 5-like [Ailuropoda melanoleuca]|uniref:interferon-inducible GTPase 5-like n=1 Tax=Ailuropoda melanoleuca TaxID=9646 RepID=UPI001494C702|nr:interferon-inducible GTPase 5-like [Ailuropoda melanoleuca]